MSLFFRLPLRGRILLPVILLAGLCASLAAQTRAVPATGTATSVPQIARVDVFVSDKTPIAAGAESQSLSAIGKLELWNLDDMERFNARLAVNLPRDITEASRIVAERATNLSADEQTLLTRAANGQTRADGLHVERLPAVVINERHVYYGAPSIEAALQRYRSGQ